MLKIGWAEESLVPNKKISLVGQFYERISQYVESPITVTACAIESCGDCAILLSVDIISMEDPLIEGIRARFASICSEVDPQKLIIFATHTHTSLNARIQSSSSNKASVTSVNQILSEFFPSNMLYTPKTTEDQDVMTAEEGFDLLTGQAALAAKHAWESREEAYYANEFGRAAVGMCRRVTYDDGSGQMWGDTNTANFVSLEGGNDSGVELLYTFDKNKKLTGIWANIACPAQILEQRSVISSDYWGKAREYVREKLGEDIYFLSICGAGGDQCPRDLVRWVNPETPIDDPNVKRPNYIPRKADPSMFDISGCKKVGKRIANEILSVYEDITEYCNEPIFGHVVKEINLPLRKVTIQQHEDALNEIERYVNRNKDKGYFDFSDTAKMHVYAGTVRRFREQQCREVVAIEYHVMRLGDICLTTSPFELFLDYGNRIKARSYAKQTFVAQLCCGSLGYLPTEKAEKAGHYSAYVSSGYVGHEGGDLLVRDTLTEIQKLFEE